MSVKLNPVAPKAVATTQQTRTNAASADAQSATTAPADGFEKTAAHGAGCQCGSSRCGTPEPTKADVERINKMMAERLAQLGVDSTKQGGVIDVYFHVINKGEGAENGDVAHSQITEQIQALNDQFAGTGFSFKLQEVTRTTNEKWFTSGHGSAGEKEMKNTLRQGGVDALNIYTSQPGGGLLGWATFPWDLERNGRTDGVVLLHTSLPGGTSSPYNEGATGTHEVGHWLGLWHTFQQPSDEVSDTPGHPRPDFGKPDPSTDTNPTDPGPNPVHNYMNYTDDDWMFEWTPGQIDRMQVLFQQFRRADPKAVREAFYGLDTNDDAQLSRREVGMLTRQALGVPGSVEAAHTQEALFAAADADKSRYVTKGELRQVLVDVIAGKGTAPADVPTKALEVFDSLDADKDGALAVEELHAHIQAALVDPKDPNGAFKVTGLARVLVHLVDRNSTGKLDRAEMEALAKELAEQQAATPAPAPAEAGTV